MKKTVGYIVMNDGGVKELVKDILWHTSSATLFTTRHDAQQAIKRTAAYATKHQYPWGVEDGWIVRVTKA